MLPQKRGSLHLFCLLWFGATAGIGALVTLSMFALSQLLLSLTSSVGNPFSLLIFALLALTITPICIGIFQGLLLGRRYPANNLHTRWSKASTIAALLPALYILVYCGGIASTLSSPASTFNMAPMFVFTTLSATLFGLLIGHIQGTAFPFRYLYANKWRLINMLAWLLASIFIMSLIGILISTNYYPVRFSEMWWVVLACQLITWLTIGLVTSIALFFILGAAERRQLIPYSNSWYIPSNPATLTQAQKKSP